MSKKHQAPKPSNDLIRAIYQVFDTAPLTAQQADLYVPLDDVRGSAGIVSTMANKIRLASASTCQVLTGHRGSGKSTELGRLRQLLEEPEKGVDRYFVVDVDADDHIDRNDVDFPDILIAIVREVAAQLKDRQEISLNRDVFAHLYERVKNLLKTEVEFESVSLSAGMGELSAKLKQSPNARLQIRKLLEPVEDNWLTAANDVLGDAILLLNKKGFSGLVVIVDGLDKMIGRPHEKSDGMTTDYLFVQRSGQLTAFDCHVVYAMPLELAYSRHEQKIKALYGGSVPVLPMTKLAHRPPKGKAYKPGMDKFREIIAKRLESVSADKSNLFQTPSIENDLIKLSGGQPDELMRMVRESIITEGLPFGRGALRRCSEDIRRTFQRMFLADHWPILQQVRETGAFVRTRENDDAIRELLDCRAILQYRNADEWYALHPAIADLQPPAPNPGTPSDQEA